VIPKLELQRGIVVTPLYDPTGQALKLFGATAASVLGQREVDFDWIISVQACHASYGPLLTRLGRDPIVFVRETQDVQDLHGHLTYLMQSQNEHGWMHILCQDDRYSFANSLRCIVDALATCDAVFVRPQLANDIEVPGESAELGCENLSHGNNPPTLHIERSPPATEIAGVNRFGGLSTVALRTSIASGIELSLDLLSDLELRRKARECSSRVGVLAGGLVSEVVWHGQAQNSLSDVRHEFETWPNDSAHSCIVALRSSATAYAYGYPELGAVWMSQLPAFGRAFAPLFKLIGRARSMFLAAGVRRKIWCSR